jgi:hypothetical protein
MREGVVDAEPRRCGPVCGCGHGAQAHDDFGSGCRGRQHGEECPCRLSRYAVESAAYKAAMAAA